MSETFEEMLTGGHPNSLGRTVEVVEIVQANPARLTDLFNTYASADPVVRLRVSSALKRLARANDRALLPVLDRLLTETAALDQPSAQWTLAQIFPILRPHMSPPQRARADEILKRNLAEHSDWIVLCETMKTLGLWSATDPQMKTWLRPQLDRHVKDPRKTVSRIAAKTRDSL